MSTLLCFVEAQSPKAQLNRERGRRGHYYPQRITSHEFQITRVARKSEEGELQKQRQEWTKSPSQELRKFMKASQGRKKP